MTNIAVVEGPVTLIGFSANKKGVVFSVETIHGPVRCFLQGSEGMTVPENISVKGHIRSEDYDGEILEEVFVEMYAARDTHVGPAAVSATGGSATEEEGWEDIPPVLPGVDSEI